MNLLDFLNKNRDTRKIFGKKELGIIKKQLLGINLTQSEKNRLSRDIRKKFNFMNQVSKFSEDFNLKKGNITKQIVEETKEIILEDFLHNKITKIILYGSLLENKFTHGSDIDMAVEFSDIDIKEATKFRKRLAGRLNSKVDIQVFNLLPDIIKNEIKLKGKILYKK